ncbi:sulfatase [Thalassoglobus sp. JC818]|uniref:sulfatase n=1 Tax=Thalassoglobus sp. JC818 TaxID=3232136 RepID=UPI00345A3809
MRIPQLLLLLIASAIGSWSNAEEPRSMNVLMIAIDDLNDYPSLMQNYPGVKTPNFDAFAKTALHFTRAYCPGTMCNPSRSAILSGVAPYRSGIYQNGQLWQDSALLNSVKTMPQVFRDSGYHTMGSGKLYHSKPTDKQWVAQWDDDEGGSGKFAPNVKPNPIPDSVEKPPLFNYGAVDQSEVSDFQLLDFARKRLAASYDKPFFMAHGIRYPHNPWVVPQRFLDLYPDSELTFPPPGYKADDLDDVPAVARDYAANPVDREALERAGHWKPVVRHYLASVSAADEVFGEVINALDASPYADNTIVVVWADHGFHLGEKDHFAKYALWEQTTNVLFMVRVPGMTSGGSTCERTVLLQDLYPTLVDLCQLKDPGHRLDGRSLLPLLKSPEAEWPYPAITTHMRGDHAVRSEDFRFIRYHNGSQELYDEAVDPNEWTNLAEKPEFKTVIEELEASLPKENAEPPPSSKKQKRKQTRKQLNQ